MTPDQRAVLEVARTNLRDALTNALEAERHGPPKAGAFLRDAQYQIAHAANYLDRVLEQVGQE